MAEVTINNSPIHSDSIITALYGETGTHWAHMHTGSDFAPYGSTPANPDLYSVCSGSVSSVVTYTGSQLLGNQIVIYDNTRNLYWRYCHMQSPSPLSVGDVVTTATKVRCYGYDRKCNGDSSSFGIVRSSILGYNKNAFSKSTCCTWNSKRTWNDSTFRWISSATGTGTTNTNRGNQNKKISMGIICKKISWQMIDRILIY